jgi:hypothetical protein
VRAVSGGSWWWCSCSWRSDGRSRRRAAAASLSIKLDWSSLDRGEAVDFFSSSGYRGGGEEGGVDLLLAFEDMQSRNN